MNKIGYLSLSFDDGRKDTYNVFMNILKPLGIPATVNIPSGYIESGFNDSSDIGFNGLMSKDELTLLVKEGIFEVSGHGYNHDNSHDGISLGLQKLREWYPDIKITGFASPHSEINRNQVEREINFYKSVGLEYVRGGRNFGKCNYYKRALALLSKKTHSVSLFKLCYKTSVNPGKNFYYSDVSVLKENTVEQIIAIIKYTINTGKYIILEFHGIDNINSKEYLNDYFCWDIEKFKIFCNEIKKMMNTGELKVLTTSEFSSL